MNIIAICKDCGNGTLNGDLNRQFDITDDNDVYCLRCSSTHVDVVSVDNDADWADIQDAHEEETQELRWSQDTERVAE